MNAAPATWTIEAFHDGDCPLCEREVRLLRRLDRQGKIKFTDIAAPGFDPVRLGKTHAELMGSMHGRLHDGTWISGVDVFRAMYQAVGFGPLVKLSRLPGVSGTLDAAYKLFARNRLRWTGRRADCQAGTCAVPSAAGGAK